MLSVEELRQYGVSRITKLFFSCLAFLVFFPPSTVLAHPCVNAVQQLRGDLGVVGNRGGLWSLMEQRGLKENSVIGMRIDGKLARMVGQFEALCESEKKPGKKLFISVQNILGDARVIFNPRSSLKELMGSLNKLNKSLDTFLPKMK